MPLYDTDRIITTIERLSVRCKDEHGIILDGTGDNTLAKELGRRSVDILRLRTGIDLQDIKWDIPKDSSLEEHVAVLWNRFGLMLRVPDNKSPDYELLRAVLEFIVSQIAGIVPASDHRLQFFVCRKGYISLNGGLYFPNETVIISHVDTSIICKSPSTSNSSDMGPESRRRRCLFCGNPVFAKYT